MTALLKLDKNDPVASHFAVKDWTWRISEMSLPVKTGDRNAQRTVSCGPRLFWTGSDVLSFGELRPVWRLFFLWAALPALWEGPAVSVNQTCSTKPGDEHPLVATAGIASVWTRPASSQEKLCSSKGIEGCSQDSHRLPSALRLLKRLLALFSCSEVIWALDRAGLLQRGKGSWEIPLSKL